MFVYPEGFDGIRTTGGDLTMIGTGFTGGGSRAFQANEMIVLTIDGDPVDCIQPMIQDSNTITCQVPEGAGTVAMALTVCNSGTVASFQYATPRVSGTSILTVEGNSQATLIINGTNFGPSSRIGLFTDDEERDSIRFESGENCTATFVDHTSIICTFSSTSLDNPTFTQTTLVLNVGGLIADGEISLGQRSSVDPALIAGLAGGLGGCCCIMLCILVILGAAYKKKKGSQVAVAEAPFTPVEMKNFSTVIFGSEPISAPKKNNELSRLLELLVNDPEMKLALEIGELTLITEADTISKAMIIVFENAKKTLDMLKFYIEQEVINTENPATLFRANSIVSKMFKFYSRLIGLPYLYNTIGKTITQLNFENLGIEVDPEKMVEGEDLNEMRWTLMAQSQKILKHILKSGKDCPPQFRHLCWQLKESVSEKYPESIDKTIGGFIFLRFFCPAITSPEIYGIIDEPPSSGSRRLLILITKSLQNLANDVEFGSKEPYMSNMNDFINENRGRLHEFYETVVLKPSEDTEVNSTKFPKGVPEKSLQEIAEHLSNNLDKIKNQELRRELSDLLQN